MKISRLNIFTSERSWVFMSLMVVSIAILFFTSAPSVLVDKEVSLPPAYQLKALHPFADTSTLTIPEDDIGERSHGAKITPRLAGSILLYLATSFSFHPYVPATLFGIFYLVSGILIGHQITDDRLIGLFLGLTFAGLYASSACFSINYQPKPFDGIALGLLGLTLIFLKHRVVLAAMAFVSCWADERAILSLFFIAVLVIAWPELDKRTKLFRCLTISGAIFIYFVTRLVLSHALGWGGNVSMIGGELRLALLFFQLAAWACFEGGWIPIALAIWALCSQKNYALFCLFLGSVILAILSSLLVIDISRGSSFAFPLIPASYALLKGLNYVSKRELRIVAGAGAIISLLSPNFEILKGVVVKLLPPLFPLHF